jgi:hypothetical protein
MKDGSNKSDKVACPRSGDEKKDLFETTRKKHIVRSVYGGPFVLYKHFPQQVVAACYHIPTHNQQLPIKDKLSRLQMQSLFNNDTSQNNLTAPVYPYQSNTAVPVVAPGV